MSKEALEKAIAVANTLNNEGVRLEMKVNAIVAYLLGQGESSTPSEPVGGFTYERLKAMEEAVANLITDGLTAVPVFLGPGANDQVWQQQPADAVDEHELYDIGEQPEQTFTDVILAEAALVEQKLASGGQDPTIGTNTSNYANHASTAPSTSLYEVLPERAKLERMSKANLIALAAAHNLTVNAEGTNKEIIDAMLSGKGQNP